MKEFKIGVLGDGGWGTTLAIFLQRKGFPVTLWGAFPQYVNYLQKHRINSKFLPGVKIPDSLEISNDLAQACLQKQLIILSTPAQYIRQVLRKMKNVSYPRQAIFLSVVKGIEMRSLKRMSEVIHEELGPVRFAVLSGPTIALEVAGSLPTTAVVAAHDKKISKSLQDVFMDKRFRIYTSSDVTGVELGGSLKNIIAIACGISDGLGFGTNAKAALLSRGLAEISCLGQVMGARLNTFFGLSGLGDLVTTCISPYSRNRFVGEQIGKGKSLSWVRSHMQMVAEGITTTKSAYELSLKNKVEMPITKEVYLVLYKNKSPLKAVRDLMTRAKREE